MNSFLIECRFNSSLRFLSPTLTWLWVAVSVGVSLERLFYSKSPVSDLQTLTTVTSLH